MDQMKALQTTEDFEALLRGEFMKVCGIGRILINRSVRFGSVGPGLVSPSTLTEAASARLLRDTSPATTTPGSQDAILRPSYAPRQWSPDTFA